MAGPMFYVYSGTPAVQRGEGGKENTTRAERHRPAQVVAGCWSWGAAAATAAVAAAVMTHLSR